MNIKVIVTDLDDTLLRGDKTISDYTIDVFKKCRDKEIKIVFATARSIQASKRFLERFAPDIFVGYGGAVAVAENEIIHRSDIPAGISYRLINECLQTPDILYIHATNESVAYTNKKDPSDTDSSHYRCVDFSNYKDISYLKISLIAAKPNVVERIALNYPMLDMLRYTGENLYRFASRDAVKWNAVMAAAKYYNISTDEFIAFGDDYIDLEMLQKCGAGVAVENAVGEVKAAAKYICGSNDEDGAAKWIEERVL